MSSPAPTLLCPVCRYDLTGLPRNVCPECGGEFDPAAILANLYAPRRTPAVVRVIGVLASVFGALVFLPALGPDDESVVMIVVWLFAGLAAAAAGPAGEDARFPGGLWLLMLSPTILLSLTPLPDVCLVWCAAAAGCSVGFAMLTSRSRRSPVVAALAGVSLPCLMLGPKYLCEDFPWWWGGFHWSNWYNMTAAQSVALGCSLTVVGIGCAATAIATTWNRRAASYP